MDGGYGPWGSWSQCSITCGKKKGVRTRDRLCNHPAPQNGGNDCSNLGKGSETESCKPPVKTCPGTILLYKRALLFHALKTNYRMRSSNILNYVLNLSQGIPRYCTAIKTGGSVSGMF